MNIRKLLRILAAVAIAVALICVLPFIRFFSRTLPATVVVDGQVQESDVTVTIRGSLWDYLIRTREMKGTITCSDYNVPFEITKEASGFYPKEILPKGLNGLTFSSYDPNKPDRYFSDCKLFFNDKLDTFVLVVEESKVYVCTKNTDADPLEIMELYLSPWDPSTERVQ